MLICEVCRSAFAATWSASLRLCQRCLDVYRQTREREQRKRDWLQAQFDLRAAQRTAQFKVRVGKLTDFPGSVSGPLRIVAGDAIAEAELILLDLYQELTPREWLALGELGYAEGERGDQEAGGSELA